MKWVGDNLAERFFQIDRKNKQAKYYWNGEQPHNKRCKVLEYLSGLGNIPGQHAELIYRVRIHKLIILQGGRISTLLIFCRCTVESILAGCIGAWFDNSNAQEWRRFQQVVSTALLITGAHLLTVEGIYRRHHLKIGIPSGHALISPLSFGKKVQEPEECNVQDREELLLGRR